MSDLVFRSFMAGLLFGIWPILMQRSGLAGNVSSAIFAAAAFAIVLPFALHSGVTAAVKAAPVPLLAPIAGIVGGFGLLFLNGMLAKVSVERIGAMFVVMVLTQLLVPVVYQFSATGEYPMQKVVGVVLAILATVLLVV